MALALPLNIVTNRHRPPSLVKLNHLDHNTKLTRKNSTWTSILYQRAETTRKTRTRKGAIPSYFFLMSTTDKRPTPVYCRLKDHQPELHHLIKRIAPWGLFFFRPLERFTHKICHLISWNLLVHTKNASEYKWRRT